MASLKKRGSTFYLQFYAGGEQKRTCLHTSSLQIAKDKVRQYESAVLRGDDCPLPTRTPVAQVLAAYARDIRSRKTPKGAQGEIYYLREAFGPICPELAVNSRRPGRTGRSGSAKKDGRKRSPRLEAECLEQITTAQIATFISDMVQVRGLSPKTANHYRQILTTLFNWAMTQHGVRMPGDKNPGVKVARYRERAPEIRHLTLAQIDEQLEALKFHPQLQVMVAMYIYAGLRREELLWLTVDDIDLKQGPHGVIRVRAKTINGESWQPKTKVNRAVPISSALRKFLDRYTPPDSDHGWFFPSPWGKRWDPDNFSQELHLRNKLAGLQWSCLDYRHTFGSQLAIKGESLYKISKLMGNSPEICRRHYAALVPEELVDTVEFPTAKPTLRLAEAG